jgi:hypothetical protein
MPFPDPKKHTKQKSDKLYRTLDFAKSGWMGCCHYCDWWTSCVSRKRKQKSLLVAKDIFVAIDCWCWRQICAVFWWLLLEVVIP